MSKPPSGYRALLNGLSGQIKAAQIKAAVAVNTEMITLYWRIGGMILSEQAKRGWGAKVIDQLSADLRKEFPQMRGLSARNLKYMRAMVAGRIQARKKCHKLWHKFPGAIIGFWWIV